jgi:hypothetical protein
LPDAADMPCAKARYFVGNTLWEVRFAWCMLDVSAYLRRDNTFTMFKSDFVVKRERYIRMLY